jgi:septum formation protein
MTLVLATSSPRRKELFQAMKISFVSHTPVVEEVMIRRNPALTAIRNAGRKAREAARLYPDDVVVAADTIVYCDDILTKPRVRAEAVEMLRRLSGRIHRVYSGLAVIAGGEERCRVVVTAVKFRAIDDERIDAYLSAVVPYDKAGAYAIQERGKDIVDWIAGSYWNVVGLPLEELRDAFLAFPRTHSYAELIQRGVDRLCERHGITNKVKFDGIVR